MLDAKFYDTLSRLQLRMSHKSSLNMAGGRKSIHKGLSAEFSDFREYMEEKEAVVCVLIDTSASMDYGEKSKAELARDLAAVVSFLALNNMDRVLLYDMKDKSRGLSAGWGRNSFAKVLRWVENLSFSGETDMIQAAKKIQYRGSGVTVIISDFLHPAMLDQEDTGYEKLLQYLSYRRQRPVILHTMAEEELRITLEGALNLIDSETQSKLRLTMDAEVIHNYERELKRLTERMKKGCQGPRGAYVLCDTGRDRSQLIFQDLRVIYDI